MNITNLKTILPILANCNIVPFIWGTQGIGKTQSVKQVADKLGIGFVHLHLATQEVGDLIGLLTHKNDGTVEHARPEWFPVDGQGIIFLDELNRAHPDVIQAIFSFITSKSIHRHTLPIGWKIVAAGNYASDEFQVTDTSDAAWMSRFCHIELSPTPQEFTEYAMQKNATSVAEFITEYSEMLEQKQRASFEVKVTPDRRAWLEMIAPLENCDIDQDIRVELYTGIVGATAACSFINFKKITEKRITITDIVGDYDKVSAKLSKLSEGSETRFDLLASPISELEVRLQQNSKYLDDLKLENLVKYLNYIPLELLCKSIKKLSKIEFKNKEALLNNKTLCKRLMEKA